MSGSIAVRRPRHDRDAEDAEPLDLQLDHVARLQVAPDRRLADLEQAAAADRPRAEQVARPQVDIGSSPVPRVGQNRAASLQRPAADVSMPLTAGGHGQVVARARARRRPARPASPATARRTRRSPCPWPVRGGPSSRRAGGRGPTSRRRPCTRRTPPRRAPATGRSAGVSTTRRDLQLVVELLAAARRPDRVVRTADLRTVGEVEDRQAEPGLRDVAAATRPHRPDVALEAVPVPESTAVAAPAARSAGSRRRGPPRRHRRRGSNPSTRSAQDRDPEPAPRGARRASSAAGGGATESCARVGSARDWRRRHASPGRASVDRRGRAPRPGATDCLPGRCARGRGPGAPRQPGW